MNIDKLLVLNLPATEQITRRYMCSYVSPESLMPPLELISCASVAREWHQITTKLVDAIAEKKSVASTAKTIADFAPQVVLALTGFECFEADVEVCKKLKEQLPHTKLILFGHYATHFPQETLRQSGADFVILGEPELVLHELLAALKNDDVSSVSGIAYLKDGVLEKQGTTERIKDPNQLPIPAYDLLPKGAYYEPLFAKPYGMIQTMRGCPYQCNYCVKSYGSKLAQLSTERIVAEMKMWINLHQVKAIRFIDDTFTINRRRTIELCQAIIKEEIQVEWACLSRTDNLDEELLTWMKKAGCKRIYFGMESGSQRMLDIYKKNVNVEEAKVALQMCRTVGIETAAFFMSGHPEEIEQDFQETLAFAKAANLNYASFNPLTPYPGTGLFNELNSLLEFSIYPYKNEWKDKAIYDKFDANKMRFYKGFYLRPKYFIVNSPTFFKNYKQIVQLGAGMIRYLFGDKQFVISGLKGYKDN